MRGAALGLAVLLIAPAPAHAQWATTYEQFYLPGSFNWRFRKQYPAADRLFNAFDYGHAILYETLYTRPDAPASELEEKEYAFLTGKLLVDPPRVPLEESAVEIEYAKLVPEAKQMFDWAHLLHRQIYDVWADERIPVDGKDAKVRELLRYYRTRRDLAFSAKPKTMELMEGMPYSTAFRTKYPKFNGLIWAYHWLQVGLYEPLIVGKNQDERQTGVLAAVARFKQMIESPPANMPRVMPMTPAVAPAFAARYPEAAIVFDNLHSMHDVVSDILANPAVPRARKRAEILLAARRFRDDTSYVTTEQGWREMAAMMGIENMGGPAVRFLAALPTPTVERGAVMAGMDHSRHAAPAAPAPAASASPAPHVHGAPPAVAPDATDLYMRMLSDPVIRARLRADTAMRRLVTAAIAASPAEHRAHLEALFREPPPAATPATRSAPRPAATAARRTAKPAAKPPAKPRTKPAAKPPAKRDSTAVDHSKHQMKRP